MTLGIEIFFIMLDVKNEIRSLIESNAEFITVREGGPNCFEDIMDGRL